MKNYHLKVSIMGIPKLYRVIEISENCTFETLHEAIFIAFERYDPHMYSFYITKSDTKSTETIFKAPKITEPMAAKENMGDEQSSAEVIIGSVGLKEKDIIHYLFDFGDSWWHRIRVEKITEGNGTTPKAEVNEAVGDAPPQYPDD
ncbi:MAG: plasmid pRiA4b ORF-3 family protein [Reinekea sp.]|jgi:hypothetical protein